MFRRNPLVSYRVRYTYFHAEVLPRIWGLGCWLGVVEEKLSTTSPVRSASLRTAQDLCEPLSLIAGTAAPPLYPQGVRRIRKAAKPLTAAQWISRPEGDGGCLRNFARAALSAAGSADGEAESEHRPPEISPAVLPAGVG